MRAMTTPAFGLREHALDALQRARTLATQQQEEMTAQRRRGMEATLKLRMTRLFNIDGVPLTEEEAAFFTPRWFALELLEPGVFTTETLFSHVNGFAPICIIEGVLLGLSDVGLVVGTWHDDGSPDDLSHITGITDLGMWVERQAQHEAEMAVRTEDEG
jgi:hypothetical protein